MHIVHLALATDSMSSVLLDLTDDDAGVIEGATRDRRLLHLWENYREWSEASRLLDLKNHDIHQSTLDVSMPTINLISKKLKLGFWKVLT